MIDNRDFSQWRPHPWHGLEIGKQVPQEVNAYIELTPYDLVKYEIDKQSGYLRVDRSMKSSSQLPALYGFIPRTYCHKQVSALTSATAKADEDPLDICVYCERPVTKSEILVSARVIGGFMMIDEGEVDEKIIGVLTNDPVLINVSEVTDLPQPIVDRLLHYFATYKSGFPYTPNVEVCPIYGRNRAYEVIRAAIQDYQDAFGTKRK